MHRVALLAIFLALNVTCSTVAEISLAGDHKAAALLTHRALMRRSVPSFSDSAFFPLAPNNKRLQYATFPLAAETSGAKSRIRRSDADIALPSQHGAGKLMHTIKKRNVERVFIGKRNADRSFLGKRRYNLDDATAKQLGNKLSFGPNLIDNQKLEYNLLAQGKHAVSDGVKKNSERNFVGKRNLGRSFLGKRNSGRSFIGKKNNARSFIGKRNSGRSFLGKRNMNRNFLGKRNTDRSYIGKKNSMRNYLGKRFVSLRNDNLPSDIRRKHSLRYLLGKRFGVPSNWNVRHLEGVHTNEDVGETDVDTSYGDDTNMDDGAFYKDVDGEIPDAYFQQVDKLYKLEPFLPNLDLQESRGDESFNADGEIGAKTAL